MSNKNFDTVEFLKKIVQDFSNYNETQTKTCNDEDMTKNYILFLLKQIDQVIAQKNKEIKKLETMKTVYRVNEELLSCNGNSRPDIDSYCNELFIKVNELNNSIIQEESIKNQMEGFLRFTYSKLSNNTKFRNYLDEYDKQ